MPSTNGTLIDAVMNADDSRIRMLVESGADLEQVDYKGQTALLLATVTDQFRMAEYLIDHGANVFAASDFGWTPGYAAQTSKLQRGPEAEARDRVLQQMKDRGFPFPAPNPASVRAMKAEHQWPPKQTGQGTTLN